MHKPRPQVLPWPRDRARAPSPQPPAPSSSPGRGRLLGSLRETPPTLPRAAPAGPWSRRRRGPRCGPGRDRRRRWPPLSAAPYRRIGRVKRPAARAGPSLAPAPARYSTRAAKPWSTSPVSAYTRAKSRGRCAHRPAAAVLACSSGVTAADGCPARIHASAAIRPKVGNVAAGTAHQVARGVLLAILQGQTRAEHRACGREATGCESCSRTARRRNRTGPC